MRAEQTYLLSGREVSEVLTMEDALEAVESAFRAFGEGRVQMPPKVYLTFEEGDLRCMPSYVPDLGVAAVKNVNAHPGNRDLPAVMATLTLFDPASGFPLAVMDATYLTAMRTGAAGGIAARHLARGDSQVAGFIGAGRQAETQLSALTQVLPNLRQVLVHDREQQRAEEFARRCEEDHGLDTAVCEPDAVVSGADVLTTVTPAREPVVRRPWVRPGTHINAIGADAAGKEELEPAVLDDATVVVDCWEQASHSGEVNVPFAQGQMSRQDIHADIGEVVTGAKPGRTDPDEITVFDSTGLAIQDLACAARVYSRTVEQSPGGAERRTFRFF